MKLEAILIRVEELRLGKVIAEDIFANTQYPIIYKNTKVKPEHLRVFELFNLKTVLVHNEIEVEEPEIIEEKLDNTSVALPLQQPTSFEKSYLDGIGQLKKEFLNWEAGGRVDLPKVRNIMIPLMDMVLENRSYIFDLNSYSNAKDYLYHHCIATGLIAAVIAKKMGYERGDTIQLAIAGMLADSGMSRIPSRIRDKKSVLTESEFGEVRKHPYYSYLLIKNVTAIKDIMKVAVYQHHERLDGSGYPKGDRIGSISIFAQIIAVADVFHAMTSERMYRSKQSPFKVIEMIKEEEFGKFDIKVVQALMNIVVDLPIGTKIELSNLELGEVMFINKYSPTRPLVKLTRTGEIVDLSSNRSFYISRVITQGYKLN
ncbi:HD-GYP domain-containing protein [Solibacillus isronensis]|uniref:HD-GYP domain-containing protein n=1 Tax=Solibacillus isronensis TaxID=412383 RepID=UPI00203D5CE2|nr:HD-GYP domain-containing protein [Solibacillus isronensis]